MPACIWKDLERISGKPLGEYTLLNLCLDIHMTCSGASDVFSDKVLLEAVGILELAYQEWESPSLESVHFDNAVRTLVATAAKEGQRELKRRTEVFPT